MTVDKIKNLGYNYDSKKSSNVKKGSEISTQDNIQISETAKLKSLEIKQQTEIKEATKFVLSLSQDEVSINKLNEVKEKLKNGYYDNLSPEILNKTADSIIDSFLS